MIPAEAAAILCEPACAVGAGDVGAAAARWDAPGLYAWFVDTAGGVVLGEALGESLRGLIYAGQAGASSSVSGREYAATLASRITGNHLRGTVHSSTFRRTIAACLLASDDDGPVVVGREDETRVSAWMRAHLRVAVVPVADRGALHALEGDVLAILDPPLNLRGVPPTPRRSRLAALRTRLAAAPPAGTAAPAPLAKTSADGRPRGRLTREAVLRAAAEYDRLGQAAFLATYGFGRSRRYLVRIDGKLYESKAIAGVAHRYLAVGAEPLRSSDFSGGLSGNSAAAQLQRLGFEIVVAG